MILHLSASTLKKINAQIQITGSKSETNRLLLLQALYPNIMIENVSNSDDAEVMQKGLKVTKGMVDIHHAGTAMRFLTAFFASQEDKEVVLTGSARMKQRPIKILVDALLELGAEIEYLGDEGCPPLKIFGRKLNKIAVALPADVSSQYISALLLIAPHLENGLELKLEGKITSIPYIEMTLALLTAIGVTSTFEGNQIKIHPKKTVGPIKMIVESDWSAASYFYSLVALAEVGSEIRLSSYKKNSLQGDSVLATIYKEFGVETEFSANSIILTKSKDLKPETLNLKLDKAPDIAQTIAVTCFGLGLGCYLTGLHTLPIKETDRLAAMKTELEKFGAEVHIDHESLTLVASEEITSNVVVATYNDHRMAMAFAPLAMKMDFAINDAEVVSKSYPDFWKDMEAIGLSVKKVS